MRPTIDRRISAGIPALVLALAVLSGTARPVVADHPDEPRVCTTFRSGDAWKVSTACGQAFARYWGPGYKRACGLVEAGPRMLQLAKEASKVFTDACGCSLPCKHQGN